MSGENLLYNAVNFDSVVPQLRQLWCEAFGDTYAFIDNFFTVMDAGKFLHTLSVDGRVVSMLFALPCNVCFDAVDYPLAYIYAVATDKVFAGHGYMRILMRNVHEYLRNAGFAAAILVPNEEWLQGYYSGMGYKVCSWNNNVLLSRPNLSLASCYEICKINKLTDEIYYFISSCAKVRNGCVLHSREWYAMNIINCGLSGGGVFLLRLNGCVVAVAFVSMVDDALLLLALFSADDNACEQLLLRLCMEYNRTSLYGIQPDTLSGVSASPYAMMLPFCDSAPSRIIAELMLDV